MALTHLRTIADEIRNSHYYVLECDEVTDASNKEQVIVCLRWVDAHLEPHKDFIGLHVVDNITTDTIVHVLKDTVLRMNLNMSMCRAQCYDGASNMKKAAKEIKVMEPRALYLHCYGHSSMQYLKEAYHQCDEQKTYLRTSRTQTRLNHIMVLQINRQYFSYCSIE